MRHAQPQRRAGAAIGTATFFVVAPGTVAGLGPWLVTGYEFETPVPGWLGLRILGGLMIGLGLAFLIQAFVRFVVEGLGTPAPVAPTERLVVGGLYRYVRNPMYIAVGALIAGQLLLFGQAGLLAYAALYSLAVALFVRRYEEPILSHRFGERYHTYRRNVPAWVPRRTPWNPPSAWSSSPR